MDSINITECPRDAMQGIEEFIPTPVKVEYINALLKVGFDVLDFGSFVSPKAIPQLKDTAEVLGQLELDNTKTKLLAIVANERGASDACSHEQIDVLGFPFSVSNQFQLRNTNSSREESLDRVKKMLELCNDSNKKLRVYLSMAFGNPYNEDWSDQIVSDWGARLVEMGVEELALSDTIGIGDAERIRKVFNTVSSNLPNTLISAHFHTSPSNWEKNVLAAYESGCRSFDSSINGIGGCPFAEDDLVGNLATENLVSLVPNIFESKLNKAAFQNAFQLANAIF